MALYLITSPTGKQYVGITTQPLNRRMAGHRISAKQGSPYPLHAAIRKHGFGAMQVEVLNATRDSDELHKLEIETIASLNTRAPNGYNLTDGGEGTAGHTKSDVERQALSSRMIDRWDDPEFVAMRKQKSKEVALNQSPERLAAFQAGAKAYWTPETRAKRAAETGARQKLLWADPEYRARHTERLVALNKDPIKRAKISAGVTKARSKQTPERRREIALAGVAASAAKRAKIEALPAEQRDRIKAELSAAKSAATAAGRAAKKAARTPEQEAATKERYRQAALRRTPEQKEKLRQAQLAGMLARKAA